ncbi:ATP-dependent DNA helicase Q4 [Neolamprologus brichardi]|uniref:ATP-dependent DNA helicase Q4 n=1 Tax=Neolamprologus brichardi TaxID=32507 RepID=UPI001643ACA4|nr:ATP-dependent DNA helicase Q4 [Neolamprologus brichardi]
MGSETKGILGDVKENAETSKTQNRGTDSPGGESVIGFNGSPQIREGFRGGRGLGARPSPASRLSLVDRKWLERCQVFGEMGAEEKPGAGNQEMNVEQQGMVEKGEKLKGEMQGVEKEPKEEIDIERERQESLEMGRGKKSESVTGDKIVTTSTANSGKSKKEGVGKEKRKGQEEVERGQTSHITADGDNESSPKTKASKNRGKKRQREVGDTEGNTTEEGGVKKRRRGGRKKEESSDVSPSSAHGGAGKKKRSKKKEGDGEGEGKEETKGPKKMPQENLFGDIEEEFGVNKIYRAQSARARVAKGTEGNFVKINLKKKSHVKGYALRGIALRRQLSGLPAKLKAACIHSNMTMKQREAAIEKVKSGQVCLLLLSPEALVGGGGSGSGCLPSAQELPPVAFACIDEAHCVSEWSHNFRPCYLRLCKVLRERLGVRCLLGLTATATLSTALDIAKHLEISDQAGIAVRSAAVPPNLNLSVSTDREKDQALVSLLKGDRFGCLDSIIVYCTRREETVRVAALLRTCLQGVLLKENKKSSSSSRSENNPVGQRKKELARKKIRKPLKWQAESYHAGLSGSERRRVQNNFMCGELRIVVATVAFGMGLDKSDVRGIIHYNMPKSFESYVQEIGRAGRDGEPAHCHLFLDPEGGDLHELRRHIYADTVDYYTVKRLVQKVFPACKCKQIHQKQQELFKDVEDSELLEVMDVCDQESSMNSSAQQDMSDKDESQPAAAPESDVSSAGLATREDDDKREKRNEDEMKKQTEDQRDNRERDQEEERSDWPRERVCHTHERAIPIQETIEALDITEEGVETLLCYLELHSQRFVELLHPTLSVCKVSCYDGPRQLQKITKICPPIAVVLARRRMAGERVEQCDQLEFDVIEVADTMGWQLPLVKRGLRQLQWSTDRAGGRSGVLVEFSSPSFYFRSYGDLSDEEMDRVCQFLHKRVQDQERTQLYQLTACFKAFKSVAYCSVLSCVDDLDESRSLQLKSLLSEYFDKRRDGDHALKPFDLEELDKYKLLDWEDQIRADIRSFLSNRSDEKFSGRAVARIFHGIGSPCYPAQTYGKDRRYWRKYIQFDFNQLIRLATQEIIRFK